jgi:hypothetical protein
MIGNHGIRLVSISRLLADFESNFLRRFHLFLTVWRGLGCFLEGILHYTTEPPVPLEHESSMMSS